MSVHRFRGLPAIAALFCLLTVPSARAAEAIHVVLAGDSTVTDTAGWGLAFAERLLPPAHCTNTARGGQSTKSFRDGGNWQRALELHPTYVLIQFGHNDMPGKGPKRETDPQTTYRENMIRFVDEARAAGAQPILVTSIPRRTFRDGKLAGELAPYVEAVRAVAREKKVPLADLFARSTEVLERMGPEAAESWCPTGKADHTHLGPEGQARTTDLLVAELRQVAPDLAASLRAEGPQPAK